VCEAPGSMKLITLTNGMQAKVDDEDYPLLARFKWGALKTRGGRVYARTTTRLPGGNQELMHRLVLQTPLDVDHINSDGLDCRRENLRAATESQNLHNRGAQSNNTSGVKGVSWCRKRQRWVAFCTVGRKHHTKRFTSFDEAVEWRVCTASRLVGVFARHT
jgi:hypothetical protein